MNFFDVLVWAVWIIILKKDKTLLKDIFYSELV
jgi:hypothetical protein